MPAVNTVNVTSPQTSTERTGNPPNGPTTPLNYSTVLGLMPGVRCPKCENEGKEIWVIPGKRCHVCGTPCGY
ncbi:hypothetical protein MPDQ_002674 [Monascus purpureus]|uniref:Uncharacterized protein n=1 Tax=Monascus purpureus TaxID=5098 RepID=A0A507QK19_MONPU|nr:hypothetical protein MPDQ_002674 [Monascus purpureus]